MRRSQAACARRARAAGWPGAKAIAAAWRPHAHLAGWQSLRSIAPNRSVTKPDENKWPRR